MERKEWLKETETNFYLLFEIEKKGENVAAELGSLISENMPCIVPLRHQRRMHIAGARFKTSG